MARTTVIGPTMVARGADVTGSSGRRKERPARSRAPPWGDVIDRLLTALGALAAAVAVVCAFALLFHVLDEGNAEAPARTTGTRIAGGRAHPPTPRPPRPARVAVPGGKPTSGAAARPGHASVGAKAPR